MSILDSTSELKKIVKNLEMNYQLTFLLLFSIQIGFAQQYDSVIIEQDSIDSNNQVYKIGNIYIFDYEIIQNGTEKKLKTNSRERFELLPKESDSIGVSKIHLLIKPSEDSERTNENQTQITYLQGPEFATYSSTGAVDNLDNVWIHPIRSGFFGSLETCPFPFVKKPLQIGSEWTDAMAIGQGWGDKLWGEWTDELILDYSYKITGKEKIKTEFGDVECFVIESKADSKLGVTKLKSFYSDLYGFIRLEYVLLTGIQVNLWVIDFMKQRV